jgi:ABC-type branched-subunit amino acid transport system ATPase component
MVVVGGLSSSLGAVVGAVVVIGVPTLLHLSPTFIFATSGAGLVTTLMQMPGGLLTPGYTLRDALLRLLSRVSAQPTFSDLEPMTAHADAPALECRGVRVTFGGLVALDDVSLRVGQGEIVGLIGANGAGKTTLMDCVSGYVRPEKGVVQTHGRDVSDLGPEYRAYASVARTFQDARLYPGLTVRETMLVAQEPTERPTFFSALLRAPWQRESERRAAAAADEALRFFGIDRYADVHVSDLPTGVRRTCALATVLLQRPKLVLLDEPTAGLPHAEVLAFAPLIRRMRDELDCAVLLIEHDMGLVMELCDRLYALEAGRNIAEGLPRDVANSPGVIGSYLGANAATIERSKHAPVATSGARPRRVRRTAAATNGNHH